MTRQSASGPSRNSPRDCRAGIFSSVGSRCRRHCVGGSSRQAPARAAGMPVSVKDTGVVFIDPQNDVLSPAGRAWGATGASVTENRTVENMERIFKAAKERGYDVFHLPALLLPY